MESSDIDYYIHVARTFYGLVNFENLIAEGAT